MGNTSIWGGILVVIILGIILVRTFLMANGLGVLETKEKEQDNNKAKQSDSIEEEKK